MEFQRTLLRVIKKIQLELDLNDHSIAKILGISTSEYQNYKSARNLLKACHLWQLCRELQVSPQKVINDEIDYPSLKSCFSNRQILINRYQNHDQKLSSANGIKTIINSLDHLYGREFTKDIFYKFQISPDRFEKEQSGRVSSLLPLDILSELKKFGLHSEHFKLIGENTHSALNELAGKQFETLSGVQEVYECLLDEIIPKHYDDLFSYEILKSTQDNSIFKVEVSEEGRDAFSGKVPFSYELECFLQGAFKSVTKFLGQRVSEITPYRSLADGSHFSLFSVSWNKGTSMQPDLALN